MDTAGRHPRQDTAHSAQDDVRDIKIELHWLKPNSHINNKIRYNYYYHRRQFCSDWQTRLS